jgi:hypothetical protein
MEMDNQIMPDKMPQFVCKKCDFKCSKESNYKKHIETMKHKRVTESNKKMPNIEEQVFNCICGNIYKYRPGLAKHKRTCIAIKKHESNSIIKEYDSNTINADVLESETKIDEKKDSTTEKELKDLVKDLIKQNGELMKTINDIIPKIGNTTNNNTMNNNFNLNVFLNEQCKDALNISDFIDSLKITLEDLIFSKTNGISRGITDVMIKGLKELDIHKRPIHCTDIKRDIMYIKNEDKWQKDENHEMMKNTIVKIADKERTALQKWAKDNPDWMETERKQIEYLTMMRSICEPIENYNNYERKIIKNLGKEIQIDKKYT